MITLDTSALIRFLVNDDIEKAKRVRELLKSEEALLVPDVVILEINFILIKKYSATKQVVYDGVDYILALPNVSSSKEINKALKIYAANSISLADSLIIAGLNVDSRLASFDKKLIKLSKVKSVF